MVLQRRGQNVKVIVQHLTPDLALDTGGGSGLEARSTSHTMRELSLRDFSNPSANCECMCVWVCVCVCVCV